MGYQSEQDVDKIKQVSLTIIDTVEEFDSAQREELKAKALAKLTPQEREVLGFQL